MPSSYTTNGGLERIATGEQSGTWGNTTNTNFDIVDRLTSGVGTIDLSSSGAAHTLTTVNGTLSDGMYKVLVLSGATEACTITVSPMTQKSCTSLTTIRAMLARFLKVLEPTLRFPTGPQL